MAPCGAAAWNAAWEERHLQTLAVKDTTLPIHIEGTPHTEEQTVGYLTPHGEVLHDPAVMDKTQDGVHDPAVMDKTQDGVVASGARPKAGRGR